MINFLKKFFKEWEPKYLTGDVLILKSVEGIAPFRGRLIAIVLDRDDSTKPHYYKVSPTDSSMVIPPIFYIHKSEIIYQLS